MLNPRAERVFSGPQDPTAPPIGVGDRLLQPAPAAKEALPATDVRDWPASDAWAADIAAELARGLC